MIHTRAQRQHDKHARAGSKGGRATGAIKRRGDAAYYRELARRSHAARNP